MNLWQQNYDPAGNIWLSSLIASLPILFFFFALIKLKLKGYLAATWTVPLRCPSRCCSIKCRLTRAGLRGLRLLLRPVAHRVDYYRRGLRL
jgi:hypothetical protein